MSADHTPGPWHASGYLDEPEHDTDVIAANGPLRLATVHIPTPGKSRTPERARQEAIANARIMAAAPELLQALRAIYRLSAFAFGPDARTVSIAAHAGHALLSAGVDLDALLQTPTEGNP